MDYQLFKELGVSAIIVIPLFFLIKWIADEFKTTLNAHRAERQLWADLFAKHQECIVQHNERAGAFQERVAAEHSKMVNNLDEITKTLGRINGYKDDK